MSFLLLLRDTAKRCSNKPHKKLLVSAADDLDFTIKAFYERLDEVTLRQVNSMWARAQRILDKTPPEHTIPPRSGDTAPAKLAA